MKSRLHLIGICALALAASGIAAAATPAKSAGKSAAKPAAKTEQPKAEEPPPEIEGFTIARARGFLGLKLSDSQFVLTFYDAERKKMAPDVASAVVRWKVRYQKADERALLERGGDAHSLTATKPVKPPHSFKVYLTLVRAETEQEMESYVFDFQG